jgi:hypothetical protein
VQGQAYLAPDHCVTSQMLYNALDEKCMQKKEEQEGFGN